MKTKTGFLVLSAALLSVGGGKAFAWGDLGHQATGEIAERFLTPAGKSLVQSILGIEPMAAAAIFPDIVRVDQRFDGFKPYHIMELPNGANESALEPKNRAPRDAHSIISGSPYQLMNKKVGRDQKILLLRYLIHVVGDVHQPLHVGNGFDAGANFCYVNYVDADGVVHKNENLHNVWDERIIEFIGDQQLDKWGKRVKYFNYPDLANLILNDPESKAIISQGPAAVFGANVLQWYQESQALHSEVYPDGGASFTPQTRPYCKIVNRATNKIEDGVMNWQKVPTLDQNYSLRSWSIVKLRILRGGLRLAHLINTIADKASVPMSGNPMDWDAGLLESIHKLVHHEEPARPAASANSVTAPRRTRR